MQTDPTFRNLAQVIAETAARQPEKEAVVTSMGRIAYGRLLGAADRVARAALAAGWGRGSVVAVAPMRMAALRVAATLGLARIGAAQLPLSSQDLAAEDFAALRARFGLAGVIAGPEGAPAGGVPVLTLDRAWLAPSDQPAPPAAEGGELPLLLSRSSGTTARPKAFMLTQRAQLARALHQQSPRMKLRADDRVVSLTGVSFQSGLSAALHMLVAGATLLVPPNPASAETLAWIEAERATYLLATPVHLAALVEAAGAGDAPRLPGLRVIRGWTAAMDPALSAAVMRRLSPNLHMAYGANEVGGLAEAGPAELARAPETIGRAYPGVTLDIIDEAGNPVPDGVVGEVRVRAPGAATAYLDDPDATARAFRDGWFHPGDLALRDAEGLLFLKGRTDEVINYSGTLVSPAEIEAVLQAHPNVVEAAAFGLPDPRHQQIPVAAVVTRGRVKLQELMDWCAPRLGHRAPAGMIRMESLPRSELGKVVRRELVEAAKAKLGR